jgi:hypothetical protein
VVAVAILLVWAGYSQGLFGWSLWQGYNLTLGQLMSPVHPYSGAWPPPQIPAGQTWPGNPAGTGTGGAPALGNIGGLIGQGAEEAAAGSVTNSNTGG